MQGFSQENVSSGTSITFGVPGCFALTLRYSLPQCQPAFWCMVVSLQGAALVCVSSVRARVGKMGSSERPTEMKVLDLTSSKASVAAEAVLGGTRK